MKHIVASKIEKTIPPDLSMIRLSDGIYLLQGKNRGRYPYSNSLLIESDKVVLVDTGCEVRDIKPDLVINTHWHEDHIAFNRIYSGTCPILVHRDDVEAVESYEEFKRRYGKDELARFFVNLFQLEFVKAEPFDELEMHVGNVEIHSFHTPGHSAGHVAILAESREKVLFLADIDLTAFGPWYGCVDSDIKAFLKSIDAIIEIVDEEEIGIAATSHGGVVRGKERIAEKLERYRNVILERDERIRRMMREVKDIDELVGKGLIYRNLPEPREIFAHFERTMLKKHLMV